MTPQEQFRQNQPAIEAWTSGQPIEWYCTGDKKWNRMVESDGWVPQFGFTKYRPVDTANVRRGETCETHHSNIVKNLMKLDNLTAQTVVELTDSVKKIGEATDSHGNDIDEIQGRIHSLCVALDDVKKQAKASDDRIAALENRVSGWETSWVKVPPQIIKTGRAPKWRRFADEKPERWPVYVKPEKGSTIYFYESDVGGFNNSFWTYPEEIGL
jgi:hypothetical protein